MASHYLFWRSVSEKVCYDVLISCSVYEKTSLDMVLKSLEYTRLMLIESAY